MPDGVFIATLKTAIAEADVREEAWIVALDYAPNADVRTRLNAIDPSLPASPALMQAVLDDWLVAWAAWALA